MIGPARLALAVVVVAGLVAPVPSASSQPAPAGRVSLASQTPWVPEAGTFRLQVDVAGVRRPEAVELAVTVHAPVTSRSQFVHTLEGRLLGTVIHRVPVERLTDLEVDAGGAISFDLPISPPGAAAEPSRMVLPGPGVYPVSVVLREAGAGAVLDEFTTHLVRERGDDAQPLAVAWVQPFGAPPALEPDGTADLDRARLDQLAALAEALSGTDLALTLVPRPETLDALAAEAPAVLDALARAASGRHVVAAPYADVDVASLVDAGLGDELTVQRERGAAATQHRVGVAPDPATWVSEGGVDGGVIDALAGVERLVLPEDALAPLDRPLTLANPFLVEGDGGDPVEAVVADEGLASHLSRPGDPVLRAHHLLADLAVLAYDSPGLRRGVVIRPPPEWDPSPEFVAAALEGLRRSSVVVPVTLDALFRQVPLAPAGGTDLVRELEPSRSDPVDLAPGRVRELRRDIASLGSVTQRGPEEGLGVAERLLLVAQDHSLDRPERQAYLDGVRRIIDERLRTVTILSQGNLRLTAREATIPLTLVNHVDAELRVSLLLRSEKLDFVGPEGATTGTTTIPLTLVPGNNAVVVPVEARASGDFALFVSVRSPDGELSLATTRITVRSTFLSGMGLMLSAGAGLFLLGWWASHWRGARRDRRLVPIPQ